MLAVAPPLRFYDDIDAFAPLYATRLRYCVAAMALRLMSVATLPCAHARAPRACHARRLRCPLGCRVEVLLLF